MLWELSNPPCRHSSIKGTHLSEDIQKAVGVQEVQLKQIVDELNNSRPRLESELADTTARSPPADTEEDAEEQSRAIEELKQQKAALQASQTALEKALAQIEHRTGVKVTNITVDGTGKVLAGLINTQGKYMTIDVTVDDIKSTNGGKVIAGVVEGVNIDF
jgi:uncharacterized protein YhaN